jgi:uncharacterized SAM-binding protein YcdF (DUF218 family)
MDLRLLKIRRVPVPTFLGSAIAFFLAVVIATGWWFGGEAFLSVTDRLPSEVLVVEGWIGPAGIRSAYSEFLAHGYKYVVVTGALSDQIWNDRRWSFALEAEKQMLSLGLPREQLLVAVPIETESQRTYQSAEAVLKALDSRGLHPRSANIFTMGVHARRSRLVFSKVLGPEIKVGAVSWLPSLYVDQNWRSSSEHAADFLKESVGYVFELLFNSGRPPNIGR